MNERKKDMNTLGLTSYAALMVSVLIGIVLFLHSTCYGEGPPFKALRVAHAGGGINGKTYTNSYDALNYNIENGFTYFEIDFSFTKDEKLVCLHDWTKSFKKSFGFETKEKITLKTFDFLVRTASEFEKCTLDGLASWMRQNPRAIIITDIKENNIKALSMISKKIQNASVRVIPQIYQPQNYNTVKKMGYKAIIWTLYLFNGSDEDVLVWVDEFSGAFAITMPRKRATTKLPKELSKKNIPTYVHTINRAEEANRFIDHFGITEIYTDFLKPVK